MDSRRLRCFVALGEELHFRRAAERCHISQSGLSQQLRSLEEELQVNLVYRTKRVVSLTEAGAVFLREARKALAQMEQAASLAQRTARGEAGQLLVGATAPALFILVPEIVRRFRMLRPHVGLIVQEMTTMEQEIALRLGHIEVGVVHPPLEDLGLTCTQVADVPFRLVMSRDNVLAGKDAIGIEDLADQKFILFPRQIGPRLYDTIIGLCQTAGFSPDILLEASPAQSIIALAAAGFGVGWIASELQQFPRADVVYRALTGPSPRFTLGVCHRGPAVSPSVDGFIQAAIAAGRQSR